MSLKLRESGNKSKCLCLNIQNRGKKGLVPGGPNSSNIYQLPATRYIISPYNFKLGITSMLFALYYIIAFIVLILHFTGHLERWGMQWLVLVLAVTVFPAVIYL